MIRRANYEYWTLRDLWTVGQAIQLLLGVEPIEDAEMRFGYYRSGHSGKPLKEYKSRMAIACDAMDIGTLEPFNRHLEGYKACEFRRVRPTEFLKWAQSKGFDVPEELQSLLEPEKLQAAVQTEDDDLDLIEDQTAGNDAARSDVPLSLGGITRIDLEYDERLREALRERQSTDEDVTPEPGISMVGAQTKVEKRVRLIQAVGLELGFDLQAIPDTGKKRIKTRCLNAHELFTDATFDAAWKAARKRGVVKIAKHEKFTLHRS